MIVKATAVNSVSHAGYLGAHLVNANENEVCEVWEIDSANPDDLKTSLIDFYQMRELTKSKTGLFSLAFNPEKSEKMTKDDFYKCIEEAEKAYNLVGQNRAVVYHEKIGTDGKKHKHVHVVWQTTDTDKRRNVAKLHYYQKTAVNLARSLERQLQQKPVTNEKSKTSYTLKEKARAAKANDRDPARRKKAVQTAFAQAKDCDDFKKRLKVLGYDLAEGIKGKCLVKEGQVFNLSKDLKTVSQADLSKYFSTMKEKIPDAKTVQTAQLFQANRRDAIKQRYNAPVQKLEKKADYLMMRYKVESFTSNKTDQLKNEQKQSQNENQGLRLTRTLGRDFNENSKDLFTVVILNAVTWCFDKVLEFIG